MRTRCAAPHALLLQSPRGSSSQIMPVSGRVESTASGIAAAMFSAPDVNVLFSPNLTAQLNVSAVGAVSGIQHACMHAPR